MFEAKEPKSPRAPWHMEKKTTKQTQEVGCLPRSPRSSQVPGQSQDKREPDKRYFMGSYGTFNMDTIHGRLFEMQVYVESLQMHTFIYFAFALVALILWPIAALLSVPLSYVAGNDKDLQMFKLILVLSTGIGLLLWTCPIFIVSLGGGMSHFHELIVNKEINFLDFVDFVLAELMILLTIIFAWVFHDTSITTEKYKHSALQSWRSRHDEYGLNVQVPKTQYNRILKVLKEEAQGEESESTQLLGEEGGTIFIEDVVRVLEVLPGWNSATKAVTDNFYEALGVETGLFADLTKLTGEAKEKSIWPIDIWLVREQFYPGTRIDLDTGLTVAYKNTVSMLSIAFDYISKSPVSAIVICILAAIRALLPRLWLWLVLGGKLWPSDPFSAAGRLVAYSTLVTFAVSSVWIGLFGFVLMEYRRNVVQCVILSALVDMKSRVKLSQYFLMSCMWFGLGPDESESVLAKLPLLDLRVSSNIAAFWRLREYVTLDRMGERMAISFLLEIVIIWLVLKFAVTMGTMYVYGGLPAVLIVTLFDLIVFGVLIIIALKSALEMNGMMDQHKQVFVEAKHEVTLAHGARLKELGHRAPKDLFIADKDHHHDLELARRLLIEYLDVCNESDNRDKILFGMTITPGKILSSIATAGAMVYTLLNKMVKNGALDVPSHMEEHISLAAIHTTTKFLASHAKAWLH